MQKLLFSGAVTISVLFTILFLPFSSAGAADGKKWDGQKYPFKLLDRSKSNSESNPFIIDTAGKLAFLSWLAGRGGDMDFDITAYGRANGLKGLNVAFRNNYVKLTADLDMNGSQFELRSIDGGVINFDGGGHVIDNLRISDRTTPLFIDSQTSSVEIYLALFQDAESIKNLGIGKRSQIIYRGGSKYTVSVWACGIAVNAFRIDNCYSEASVTVKGDGDTFAAGVAAECGYLTNSSNRGTITVNGKVIDSFSKNRTGKILPGTLRVGGVCARTDKQLSGCYNTGSLIVNSSGSLVYVGGVSADLNSCVCTDLYNTGSIRLNADGDIKTGSVGGVIGFGWTYGRRPRWKLDGYSETGSIYNRGTVDVSVITGGSICAGGIGGGMGDRGADFSTGFYEMSGVYGYINTWNTGAVSISSSGKAELNAGGIAGFGSMVINSYNTGNISGVSGPGAELSIGGLGGKRVYVQNCYSTGAVKAGGTGTKAAGGVIGTASAVWGETQTSLNAAQNGFWLRQSSGINREIKYGKGSYYYMRRGDMKKTALGKVIDSISKEDPNEMLEDIPGAVYSFDSASAPSMRRTDDAPGKRADLDGTLLYNLNEMVENKLDRLYRRWVIDGSNGGYPVLSPKPTLYSRTPVKPDASAAAAIAGSYLGSHMKWNDTISFSADGSFKRTQGGDGGTWSYDGTRLIMRWTKWSPEILKRKPSGEFSCGVYNFTLQRSESIASAGRPDADAVKKIAGNYTAQHRSWNDTLVLSSDGSFKRVQGGDSGTWSYDGKKLILSWTKWAPEILDQTADGVFSVKMYKFKLTRSGAPSSGSSAAADKPVSEAAKKLAGTYYAVHKNWTDSLLINADGTFKRGKTGEGGTWTFDGRKLVLKWNTSASETLLPSATGFSCPSYKFTLRQ